MEGVQRGEDQEDQEMADNRLENTASVSEAAMAAHFAPLKGKRQAERSPSPPGYQPYDFAQKKRVLSGTGMLSSKHANVDMPVPGGKALPSLALPQTAGHGSINSSKWASSSSRPVPAVSRPAASPTGTPAPQPRPAAQPTGTPAPQSRPTGSSPAPQRPPPRPDFSRHNPALMEQLWDQNQILNTRIGLLMQMLQSAGIPMPAPPTHMVPNARPPPATAPVRPSPAPQVRPATYKAAVQPDRPLGPLRQVRQAAKVTPQSVPSVPGAAPHRTSTSASPPSQRQGPPPSTQRRLLVSSSCPARGDPLAIREAVNRVIFEMTKLDSPAVRSSHVNGKGNIILSLMDNISADLLVQNASHIEKKLSPFFDNRPCTLTVPSRWHKVHLASVNRLDFSGPHGMDALKQEIEAYNPQLQLACTPRWLVKEIASHKVCSSVVLSFKDNAGYKKALKGVWVNGVRLRTSTFYAARPQDQCKRCQTFGHAWQSCRHQEACKYCAGKHQSTAHTCNQCNVKGKHCTHTQAKCILCAGDHFATSPDCEFRRKVLARTAQHQTARQNANRND